MPTEECMAGALLFWAIFLLGSGGAAVAWVQWSSQINRFQLPKWRSILAFTALCAATLQLIILVVFEGYALIAQDFSYRARTIFTWGRVATYLFLGAVLATIFGKGRFRLAVALSALATEAVWFALGMGL